MKNLFIFLLIFFPSFSKAEDSSVLFDKGNQLYQKEEYTKAIEKYNKILKQGFESSDLYFNLGNAYYKTGDIPSAILNLERAKKIAPSDEDILFNLKLINLKITDKIDAVPDIFYAQWWYELVNYQSADRWAFFGVGLLFTAFLLGIGFLFCKNISLKKSFFVIAILFFVASLFTFLLANAQYSYQKEQYGILFSSSSYVKSSPVEKGTDLFILHEGTKVKVLDKIGEWIQIMIPNGDKGWIKSTDVEII